jgi:hypothetical protein
MAELLRKGGVGRALEVKMPRGRVATLNAAQQAQLREALARPTGFGFFVKGQRWIQE